MLTPAYQHWQSDAQPKRPRQSATQPLELVRSMQSCIVHKGVFVQGVVVAPRP